MALANQVRCRLARAFQNELTLRHSCHPTVLAEIAQEGGDVQALERALRPQIEARSGRGPSQAPLDDALVEHGAAEGSVDAARPHHDVGCHVVETKPSDARA